MGATGAAGVGLTDAAYADAAGTLTVTAGTDFTNGANVQTSTGVYTLASSGSTNLLTCTIFVTVGNGGSASSGVESAYASTVSSSQITVNTFSGTNLTNEPFSVLVSCP